MPSAGGPTPGRAAGGPPGSRGPRRGGHNHVVLATAGLTLYLATLWLGVTVIGDNPLRSAIMAGLIVAIATAGYVFTRQPVPRDE